ADNLGVRDQFEAELRPTCAAGANCSAAEAAAERGYNNAIASGMNKYVAQVGEKAASEHRVYADKAKEGMIKSFTVAATNLITSMGSLMAARQAKKAADALEGAKNGYVPDLKSDPFPDADSGARAGATIDPNQDSAQAAAGPAPDPNGDV